MKWTTIYKSHVNTNNVDCFRWEDGLLLVWFIGSECPNKWDDPDRQLYLKLCRQQGIQPVEENDGQDA